MCRLGLAKAVKPKAFNAAQWNVDVKPLSNVEIDRLYKEVIDCFSQGGKYGGNDVVHLLMGTKAAEKLIENNFILSRSVSQPSQVVGSSSKRTDRDWDDGSEVEIVEETVIPRKVSRRC